VDQEGGRVTRLKAPFTPFPSAATVGLTGSEALAYKIGQSLGRELRAVGINMDLAPVLDVLTNTANTVIGDRAFSTDPRCVSRQATAFMHGLHGAGVLAVGKHFPGHGDTWLDSHLALPVSERNIAQLNACELLPFRESIAAGLRAVMTAHVVYKAWDARQPATLSSSILTGVLRQEMGFQGVIISDDLGMAAVADTTPWQEVPLRALRAGIDMLLVCHHRQRQEEAFASILRAVQCGALSESLLDRALTRVHALKSGLCHLQDTTPATTLTCIGSSEHQALATNMVEQSARTTVGDGLHGD
jgi:beta-N-acetylhexosaminidase